MEDLQNQTSKNDLLEKRNPQSNISIKIWQLSKKIPLAQFIYKGNYSF